MTIRSVITAPAGLQTHVEVEGRALSLGAQTPAVAVNLVNTGLTGSGVPGAAGDRHHTHEQGTAAAEWLITHGLGKRPAVTVVDSAGDQVEGDVQYIDLNSLRVTFTAAFSGRAYLN